ELTGTCKTPYPYTNSNGSTEHLTYHLHDKHEITIDNYKEHLDSSQELLLEFQPQYRIPCANTVKKLILEAHSKGINQLQEILTNTATVVHLTTDLWTVKSNLGYIGVTATWLTPDFELREALLSCRYMPYQHTSKNISEELFSIINKWNLNDKVCMIVTDNDTNVVKGIELLKDNYLVEVCRQPCATHTLQLSVKAGLKQVTSTTVTGNANKHISESQGIDNNNRLISPLEILSNSTSLQYKLDSMSRKDEEKLDQLCLNFEEKKLIDEIVGILKPFKEITRHFSGSKYPMINLIYPYVHMLKNKYAPVVERDKSVKNWLDLIYGSLLESSDQDTSISSGDEDSILLAGNRKQWQYAHRSKYSRNQGGGHKRIKDKRYSIPDETKLKASILDPRVLKLLLFATNKECKNTEAQLHEELLVLEAQFNQNNDNSDAVITVEEEKFDSLSAELWGLFAIPNSQAFVEDELTRYLKEQIAHK
ncbi:7359_t:CDS:2, partial [Gigaspora margarita]